MPLFFAIFIAMLLASPAFAACSNTCDTSTQYSCSKTTNTMAKGTSGTLSLTIANQQSGAQSSVAAELQGGWFSGGTTTTTISSMSENGGSASIDFTTTPTNDGSQNVCVRLGSTCNADCGSISVTSSAAISITSLTTSASSVTTGGTFTASASIYNGGTESASGVTATLSSSDTSKCTVASGSKSVGTISGKNTNSQSWTVTSVAAGTCSLSLAVSGTTGGSASSSASVTVNAAGSGDGTTPPGGGGGGGGGAAVVPGTVVKAETGKITITIPSIKIGSPALVNIANATETGVSSLVIAAAKNVSNVKIVVEKKATNPTAATPSGIVHSYISISHDNMTDSDVSSVTIAFQIDKAWISSNQIDDSTVALNRFSSSWSKLTTIKTGSNDANAFYNATSPGLSAFAMTGEKKAAAEEQPAEEGQPSRPSGAVLPPLPIKLSEELQKYGWHITALVIVVILLLGWFYYHGHHKVKKLVYGVKK